MITRLLEHGAPKEMELTLINRISIEHDAEAYHQRNDNTNMIEETDPAMNNEHQHNKLVNDHQSNVNARLNGNEALVTGETLNQE